MDPVQNPFAPGAGNQPPALSGRDEIIGSADIALKRILIGNHAKSQILLGLRGTGKTVLLRKFDKIAGQAGYRTSFIEAPEDRALARLLYPKIHQVLRQFSRVEAAKQYTHHAMQALCSFAKTFSVSVGDISLAVDPATGVADSGELEYDLGDLFVKTGEAARSAGTGWCLLTDEVQCFSNRELSSLIVAIHRTNQENLPVIFFGAGLPQVAALTGDAKSYAERLFDYRTVGALDREYSFKAVRDPVTQNGESIEAAALEEIFSITGGYPFFLQEWGYQIWNRTAFSPMKQSDVASATPLALGRLDEGFFKVRFDRLTPKEKEYVFAMSTLGKGPYRSAEVAGIIGKSPRKLGPCRANLINKGMIYSPAHGDIAFTVPMFEEYLLRTGKPCLP